MKTWGQKRGREKGKEKRKNPYNKVLDVETLSVALFISCSPHNDPARKKGQSQSRAEF